MMTLPSQYHSKSHQVIGRDREALALVLVSSASRRGETIVLRGAIEINILKGVKGLEPVPVDEEGNPLPQEPIDQRIAEM